MFSSKDGDYFPFCAPLAHYMREFKSSRRANQFSKYFDPDAYFQLQLLVYTRFFFISNGFFRPRLGCCLTECRLSQKFALPYLTKMLFGTSPIIWDSSPTPLRNIFRDLPFTEAKFQPSVAYKSVAYKIKSV